MYADIHGHQRMILKNFADLFGLFSSATFRPNFPLDTFKVRVSQVDKTQLNLQRIFMVLS